MNKIQWALPVLFIGLLVSPSLTLAAHPVKDFQSNGAGKKNPPTTPPVTTPVGASCTTGWYITGYFTPVESDYAGATTSVTISKKVYVFNSAFLKAVKTEGWGKTHLGNYVGYYDGGWHFSSAPLDANDHPLSTNAVAVDTTIIPFNTSLTIPTLPASSGLNAKTFIATDTGDGDVTGKHIDVYTGEGKASENITYAITGNNTVCTK